MPWCPNCKTEYREGITHCADCKVELVAEYRDVVLKNATSMLVQVDAEHRLFAQKLHDFLEYSKISSVVLDEEEMIGVYVAPEDFNQAKKCFKAFYSVETELMMQQAAEAAFLKGEEFDYFGDDEEEEEGAADAGASEGPLYETVGGNTAGKSCCSSENKTENYVSATSKYEDYRSSGFTFVILGGLGVAFALLNYLEVITLFGSGFSTTVLFLMFAVFLGLGIFSFAKANTLKEGAEKEQALIATVNEWLEKNISPDMIAEMKRESDEAEDYKASELLYLDRLDRILEQVLSAFPELHPSLAEQLIEEFYTHSVE